MQFAGQRTDAQLQPIGEPVNVLITLAADTIPDPDAIMITGITPQSTQQEGLTEAEFLRFFYDEVVKPDTTFLGFNTVRFDDEFMRYLHYRNFYDPYEWQWKDGCSRWDLLDVVRMTRALRPDGIEWPVTAEGKPTNRLELLTKANGLSHDHAHDALNDVIATITVAQLIREKQPQLFKFLFENRHKKAVTELITSGKAFVYTSGRYPSEHLHTTAAIMIARHTQQDAALVFDLRYDPTPYMAMTAEQLADAWRFTPGAPKPATPFPLKTVKFNRCPAVAPLGVLADKAAQARIDLTIATVEKNLARLTPQLQQFATNIAGAISVLDKERAHDHPAVNIDDTTVDGMLYDGFLPAGDKQTASAIRAAAPQAAMGFANKLQDERLKALLPLYVARNYPKALTAEQRQAWEEHVGRQLFDGGPNSRLARFFARLQALASETTTPEQTFLLEELRLYGESIMPTDAA